ncbi:MAG: hypothetical protein J0H08_06330 [Rhizobiales bacterium]|nr:hypothetical protein [Hyphomicrobiales bacterium]
MDDGRVAVTACYRVFAAYRFDGGCLEGADGLGPLETRLLRLTPPSEIPSDLLASYLAALPDTIEGRARDDFRALLPRLAELVLDGALPARGLYDALARAGFPDGWLAGEADVLRRVVAALGPPAVEPATQARD